jgi:hypothetical protein
MVPSLAPTAESSNLPSLVPTIEPSKKPTREPTMVPTNQPSVVSTPQKTLDSDALPGEKDAAQEPGTIPAFSQASEKQCSIDVELFCTTSYRVDCTEISTPWFCPSSIEKLTLQYTGIPCQDTHPSIGCKNFETIEALGKGMLLCVDGNGEPLNVEPEGLFETNDLISISTSFQEEIVGEANCALFNSTGTKLQSFSIPIDGDDIVHGVNIGAFQLIACSKEESCLVELQYEIAVYNDANDKAILTDVTIVSMDGSKAIHQEMIDHTIPANESFTAVYSTQVNVCATSSLQLGILAEVSCTQLLTPLHVIDSTYRCVTGDGNRRENKLSGRFHTFLHGKGAKKRKVDKLIFARH